MSQNTSDLTTCASCKSLLIVHSPRCLNHKAAGLSSAAMGDLFYIPQRCPGYRPRVQTPAQISKTDTKTEPKTEPTSTYSPPEENMKVSENSTASFTPCPAGNYLARCVRLIDIGTVTDDFQGETKTARKVLISFEILDDEARREDGSPFVLSKRYTLSLHEKASLRKDLSSWRGRDFTANELRGFEMQNILGKDLLLGVIQREKDGKTYANISSLAKPVKGMVAPEGTANEPLLFWDMSADEPDWEAFAQLHPKLQEQIQASPEFLALSLKQPKSVSTGGSAASGSGFDDLDNDVAF